MLTREAVIAQARAAGFDLCGIARGERHPKLARLSEWVAGGNAGEMQYLADSLDERADPARVLPTVRSVISLAVVYNSDAPTAGAVSRYAWGDDYHDVLRARLDRLVRWMADTAGPGFEAFSCVDNGPVQERVFAEQAGLGWIGKNTCLINPEVGSWILLGAIICSLPLETDAPALDQCGTCTLCLEACPTGAFVAPHVLDATRCISYLTIEYRGSIPEAHREAMGNHLFGCDICQEVCPWNHAPIRTSDPSWSSREDLNLPSLIDLWRRSDEELAEFIGRTPMTRAGVKGLRRNLAVALGNSGDPRVLEVLREPGDGSTADPLVVEHVEWAKNRNLPCCEMKT